MKETPMVSVIMPIYNMERYLEESLDSVLGQSFSDIEVICVDDGSKDRSAAMMDAYATKDARVRVIHKENTGYGHSMNVGLDHAHGKYISIVEPDDFIDKDMYHDLVPLAEANEVDFIKSDFVLLEGQRGQYRLQPVKIYDDDSLYEKVLSAQEKKTMFKGWLATPTCLFRRDFLTKYGIRYNETPGASYQDTGFWFQTMMFADRVYLHGRGYYHYRQDNPNASMQSKAKVDCLVHEYDYILDKLRASGKLKEYLPEYILCRFAGARDTFGRISDDYKQEYLQNTARIFKKFQSEDLLDTSAMDEQDRLKLQSILIDFKAYYQKRMPVIRCLRGLLAPYRKFFIYGAGGRGERIFQAMLNAGRERLAGFVVTKVQNENMEFLGKPVFALEDMETEPDTGVIIGVTSRYAEEIKTALRQHGIKTIVEIPETKIP